MTTPRVTAKASVFDLDAVSAARREAAGVGFTFVWHGEEYECLPAKEWPITVTSALATGDLVGGITEILGADGQRFIDTKPTAGDVEALLTALAEFSGVESTGN